MSDIELQKIMIKYSLKTLSKELASKQFCLDFFKFALNQSSLRSLVHHLGRIAKALDQTGITLEKHDELIREYASPAMRADLLNDSKHRGVVFLLFNRFALKLIDELLRIKDSSSIAVDPFRSFDKVPFPVEGITQRLLSIEGIFLLANTLVTLVEKESTFSEEESSEQTRIFYSRLSVDKAVAIGRSKMYRCGNFPLRFKEMRLEIEDFLKAAFSLCAHLESVPMIELELPFSLGQMDLSAQEILLKYLPRIASEIKSCTWDLTESDSLSKLYYTSTLCRQHPLIRVEGRYYCLQPVLLWSAISDLPFYLLLDACEGDKKKVNLLWKAWGEVFENHYRDLGQRVFGVNKCRDYLCNRKHPEVGIKQKEHRIGDLFVTLDENARILFEFKGAAPDDSIKLGCNTRVNSKFIDQLDKDQGIPQLVRDASVYRQETSFTGVIFIVFVCRGPIPLTSDFDIDVEKYLQRSSDYQEYLKNPQNRPVIWLDALLVESLFSGLRQGLPVENTLQSLLGAMPSQVLNILEGKIHQKGLKLSRAPLYDEEIESQAEQFRSMFCNKYENST